jgi:hypothetical protein
MAQDDLASRVLNSIFFKCNQKSQQICHGKFGSFGVVKRGTF